MILQIYILFNFTWQEYRSYFWWKSEYRVISEPREYTAQVSFTRLKTKSERSIKAVFFSLDFQAPGKVCSPIENI